MSERLLNSSKLSQIVMNKLLISGCSWMMLELYYFNLLINSLYSPSRLIALRLKSANYCSTFSRFSFSSLIIFYSFLISLSKSDEVVVLKLGRHSESSVFTVCGTVLILNKIITISLFKHFIIKHLYSIIAQHLFIFTMTFMGQ